MKIKNSTDLPITVLPVDAYGTPAFTVGPQGESPDIPVELASELINSWPDRWDPVGTIFLTTPAGEKE